MSDVNVREVAVERLHPLHELGILVDRREGVDEDGVAFAVDEGHGVGDPLEVLRSVREVAR